MHRGCPSALRRCLGRTLTSVARALTPTRLCALAMPSQPLLRSLASVLAITAGKHCCLLAGSAWGLPCTHSTDLIQHAGCSCPLWT